jgi:DNA-binding transcriptional LysR family regulator
MDLRQLNFLVVIAEHRSFAKAAQCLGMEPSPLARAMRRLEKSVGTAVLTRSPRGLSLTPAGTELLRAAREVLTRLNDCQDQISRARLAPPPSVRIGLTMGIADAELLALLKDADAAISSGLLAVSEGGRSDLAAHLIAQNIDLAVTPQPLVGGEFRCAQFASRPLAKLLPSARASADSARSSLPYGMLPELRAALPHVDRCYEIRSVSSWALLVELVAAGLTKAIALRSQAEALNRPEIRVLPLPGRHTLSLYICHRAVDESPLGDQVLRLGRARRRERRPDRQERHPAAILPIDK